MYFNIILNMILNRSIWLIDENLTDTTTSGQSEPGSNSHKRVTPYSAEIQKLSQTTEFSFSWPKYFFVEF